jgi:hypothetical protein
VNGGVGEEEDKMRFFDSKSCTYHQALDLTPVEFTCGYCNNPVGSDYGYRILQKNNATQVGGVYICPSCLGPVFRDLKGEFYPKPTAGNAVANLPDDISRLYNEARDCCGVGAYTASVLACRKILMHVAVDLGADGDQSFLQYVEWLHNQHHIPPNGKAWVDHIRQKGNETNHDIVIAQRPDAETLIKFTEMLLKVNYEFPGLIGPEQGAPAVRPPAAGGRP